MKGTNAHLQQYEADGKSPKGPAPASLPFRPPKEEILRQMIKDNPEVQSLIDDFGLEMTDAGQK